jgi:uncharacterized membrane protein YozB (DUF420 family)
MVCFLHRQTLEEIVKKVFSPLVWLLLMTLPLGMFTTFNIFSPPDYAEVEVANSIIQWQSIIFTGGYILAAAGIGLFTRGAARAKLSFGLGASLLLWVFLGMFVFLGPLVGYPQYLEFGLLPMVAGSGLVISGLLHWNADNKPQ